MSEKDREQEFDKQIQSLLEEEPAGKKKKGRLRRMSKKKKIILGSGAAAIAILVGLKLFGGNKEIIPTAATAVLEKGSIENILSVSGPVSGTDSVDVVSNIHAEIKSIEVKEGDKVTEGQLLAEIDDSDLLKELEIARNSYDLAVATRDENLRDARNGYAKALQDYEAARANYNRQSVLAQAGGISAVELEAAANALEDAKRAVNGYTLENGQVTADKSYELQIKNAQYNLDKALENLEAAKIKAPISGTVVRVNSKVGQFADKPEENEPIFIIENLDTLELEIKISEYSIGKVEVGQRAEIRADILGDNSVQGEVLSISPTGEEKGGGSTERVIPTIIRVLDEDTSLIAGITAKAAIVLEEAKDTWVVPISALHTGADGTTSLVVVENGICRMIPVTTGVESDISVEIFPAEGAALTEGMSYIITPDPMLAEGSKVTELPSAGQLAKGQEESAAPAENSDEESDAGAGEESPASGQGDEAGSDAETSAPLTE